MWDPGGSDDRLKLRDVPHVPETMAVGSGVNQLSKEAQSLVILQGPFRLGPKPPTSRGAQAKRQLRFLARLSPRSFATPSIGKRCEVFHESGTEHAHPRLTGKPQENFPTNCQVPSTEAQHWLTGERTGSVPAEDGARMPKD